MLRFTNIPVSVLAGVTGIVIVFALVSLGSFAIAVIMSPVWFVIYRLLRRDNIARWFVSCFLTVATIAFSYQLLAYDPAEFISGSPALASSKPVEAMRVDVQDSRRNGFIAVGLIAIAISMLHTPSSRRWFEGDYDDA